MFHQAPSRARRCVTKGDLLISTVRPNLQAFVRAPNTDGNYIASTGFAVITSDNEIIRDLIFHAFFSTKFKKYCEALVTGTSYPAISSNDVANFEINIPSNKTKQLYINNTLNGLEQSSQQLVKNIEYLTQIKKMLVYKYLG